MVPTGFKVLTVFQEDCLADYQIRLQIQLAVEVLLFLETGGTHTSAPGSCVVGLGAGERGDDQHSP